MYDPSITAFLIEVHNKFFSKQKSLSKEENSIITK